MSWHYPGPARPAAGDMGTLASDGDRDAAARVLSEALAEGRLTTSEHGERVRAALAARTWAELAGLTADLPAPADTRPAVTARCDGPDWCLLLCCPPAGIARLLAARHRARTSRRPAVTAGSAPLGGGMAAGARAGRRAKAR